jgi:hypothetical protein
MATQLMGGDISSLNKVLAFLEQTKAVGVGPNGQPRPAVYQNAESLGYFLGAIEAGAHRRGADTQATGAALAFFADYFTFGAPAVEGIFNNIASGQIADGKRLVDTILPPFDSVVEADFDAAYLSVSERDS